MSVTPSLSPEVLRLDASSESDRISGVLREQVAALKRRGVVVGLSGGVDSSVVAALAVRALGKSRVLALLMPEGESSADGLILGGLVAESLGIRPVVEDITPILDAAGCYRRRDEAIRKVVPEFGPGHKCKLVAPGVFDSVGYTIFSLVVESPDGERKKVRLTTEAYLGIVAATNFKQRSRKMIEYYHADRLQYAVAGTPNRLEYDQGFFVKNGDGAADIKPIAHLYKTQVYQIAEYLGVPEEIRNRPPTTDTYSLPQSQEEFYFSVSYERMDLCLYGVNHEVPAEEVSGATGLTPEQVRKIYADIASKRRATRYLHMKPLLVEPVEGPEPDRNP